MNHLGVNFYAHNRGRRCAGYRDSREVLPVTRQVQCPFCLGDVKEIDGRIKMHLEWRGFTLCPVSGLSLEAATAQAAHLVAGGEE
jgi:hypothetical protein